MNDLAKIEDLETRLESERHLRKSLETRLLKAEAKLVAEQSQKKIKRRFLRTRFRQFTG